MILVIVLDISGVSLFVIVLHPTAKPRGPERCLLSGPTPDSSLNHLNLLGPKMSSSIAFRGFETHKPLHYD